MVAQLLEEVSPQADGVYDILEFQNRGNLQSPAVFLFPLTQAAGLASRGLFFQEYDIGISTHPFTVPRDGTTGKLDPRLSRISCRYGDTGLSLP